MARFKCSDGCNNREFVIRTDSGGTHGTNMPYIKNCPFCGTEMSDSDCIDRIEI